VEIRRLLVGYANASWLYELATALTYPVILLLLVVVVVLVLLLLKIQSDPVRMSWGGAHEVEAAKRKSIETSNAVRRIQMLLDIPHQNSNSASILALQQSKV
jgi:hypothetical protein